MQERVDLASVGGRSLRLPKTKRTCRGKTTVYLSRNTCFLKACMCPADTNVLVQTLNSIIRDSMSWRFHRPNMKSSMGKAYSVPLSYGFFYSCLFCGSYICALTVTSGAVFPPHSALLILFLISIKIQGTEWQDSVSFTQVEDIARVPSCNPIQHLPGSKFY